jgi:hypothetical protein
VAIIKSTPRECFSFFQGLVRELIAATLNKHDVIGPTNQTETKMTLSFVRGGEATIPLKTKYGKLHFYLGQALEAEPIPKERRYRLRTRQYWYRLQRTAGIKDQAIIRWEYDSTIQSDRHCRHHVQLPLSLPVPKGTLSLNKTHLPSGWVTMEEVIRFLIVDLGVRPPCGNRWPAVLKKSESEFFRELTAADERARQTL